MAKKRKGPTPRRTPPARPPARPTRADARGRRRKPSSYEEQMFFPRLRNHAKWAFVGLALVFIVGFVVFGVGSGNGVGNLFSGGGLLSGSGSSGPSIGKLVKRTQANPKDAAAWHQLALAYQGQQQDQKATAALKRYLGLKPKDTAALANLAALYQSQAQTAQQKLTGLYQQVPSGLSVSPFAPATLAQALGADPLETAVQANLQQQAGPLNDAYQKGMAGSLATYKRVVSAAPHDAQARLQLGVTAEQQGDYKTALSSFQAFLRLAPDDPAAAQVKQEIVKVKKLLKPAPSGQTSSPIQVKPSGKSSGK